MDPAQGMQKDVKLADIITDNGKIPVRCVFDQASDQRCFGCNFLVMLFADAVLE
jgi:hypothetical protein